MTVAIDEGVIETVTTCSGPMIHIRELAEEAVHTWPLVMIEEALGAEASLVLPPDVRTRKFTARLPRYVISALHQLAEDEGETVEALVTRELHGLAYAYRKRLAAVIPGFTEALEWPLVEAAKPDCWRCSLQEVMTMRPRFVTALCHLPALARRTNSLAARRYRRRLVVAVVTAPRKEKRKRRRDGVRVFSMGSLYRPARLSGSQETKVPYFRMSGRWLEACGFEIGARVYLKVEHGRLIVTNVDPAVATAPLS
jgi:hypothetical protein